MILLKKYEDPKYGVLNAIRDSEQPFEGIVKAQNMLFRENEWVKTPGLTEINDTVIGTDPIWGVHVFNQVGSGKSFILATSGGSLYKYDEAARSFTEIFNGFTPNTQVEFLDDGDFCYFGSDENDWRRYDGGSKTYKVGGTSPPLKFKQIIFNPYAGRYFGITGKDKFLYWSNHIDNGGIEVWPASNVQIIESVKGDRPQRLDIFEGRVNIFSNHSISSGDVRGVPETWSFQREKSISGAVAARTVKRYGSTFFMLDENNDVYTWPGGKSITEGRIKLYLDPAYRHLAVAEIVDNRYYVLTFKSGQAVSSNKYHTWHYDILGDRWYGPSIQRNVVSSVFDDKSGKAYFGGIDDLAGYVLEYRGRNIRNTAMKCHVISSSSDYGEPIVDKRYHRLHIKAKQDGSLPDSQGQVELIVNVDHKGNTQQAQRIVLDDPANQNLSETGAVRGSITKRHHIHDSVGVGTAIQWELKHEVLNGDFAFSNITIEYYRKFIKKNRGV